MVDVRPPDSADPGRGWQVTTARGGSWWHWDRQQVTRREVVLAAGTCGTQSLLHAMKAGGVLPQLSDRLATTTRTNSEALVGALTRVVPQDDLTPDVAITCSFYPDQDTHVENVRYEPGSNAIGSLITLMADGRDPGDGP